MKKIFILTGEPSGDKLASTVISNIQAENKDIEYLCVGGNHLKNLGIRSIFDLKDITYLGFTSVFLNIFKIYNKINKTVDEIIKFNPDILFSVDSPDFTLRVAKKVKKINLNIKTIHYVAPQVWIWRKNRVKKIKKFIDHILLLFNFEKRYFDEENIKNTFVGHPLIEKKENTKTLLDNLFSKDKNIISLYPGSRNSETNILLPILLDFIKLMNKKNQKYSFVFHATDENKQFIIDKVKNTDLKNIDIVSDENVKSQVLSNSIFAITKSGTVSLQVSSANIPSIIVYKLSFINFNIFKFLANVKYANIINIINDREIIPELLQNECNAEEIYKTVIYFLSKPELIKKQLDDCSKTLEGIKSKTSSSKEVAKILSNYLIT
ncbi:lipid-A-disaccharide synthase [Candidatus Pelagibacter bacterium]|nr:lipid-A-disaccharide synthase [Candidatus Pelagibacter bacterium]